MKKNKTISVIEKFLEDRKVISYEKYDVQELTPFSDYYLVIVVDNQRLLKATAEAIADELERNKISIHHIEGKSVTGWILIDAFDVMINVFTTEEHDRIRIEEKIVKN